MPSYNIISTTEPCPDCSRRKKISLMKEIVETYDPFPEDEEGTYSIVSKRCFEPECNYEIVIKDGWFNRSVPYRRRREEQASLLILRRIRESSFARRD